jgi:hypothetical protein
MNFNGALRLYREERFTDLDIVRCTGLSVRAWRELIKLGSVRTITENRGRGRIRLCDAIVFKRATVIAALNRVGFSLAVSGQIAYCLPFHTLLYTICDPNTILFQSSGKVDPRTALPPQVGPKTDWFDPGKPAKGDPRTDWNIEIYDGRFVGCIYKINDEPKLFGDLRNNCTSFVAWFPLRQRPRFSEVTEDIIKTLPNHRFIDFVAEWENPRKFSKQLKLLGYKYENHAADDDPLDLAARATTQSPVYKVTVNISLAIRKALRRYLGLEPPMPV